jgi:hypothetical protein
MESEAAMRAVIIAFTGLVLAGCVTSSPIDRAKSEMKAEILAAYNRTEEAAIAAYDAEAAKSGYRRVEIEAGGFVLVARMKPVADPSAPLEIAIGGDIIPSTVIHSNGRVEWVNVAKQRVANSNSFFPEASASRDIVILERPCYAVTSQRDSICSDLGWTLDRRMSPKVISAMILAIDQIKEMRGKSQVSLFGVSAGGAIAVLIAAQRTDVSALMTQNAPFDFALVDSHQKKVMAAVRRAVGLKSIYQNDENNMCGKPCIDPISVSGKIRDIPQIHFYGSVDEMVPPENASRFAAALKSKCASFMPIAMSHYDEQSIRLWRRGIDDDPPRCR